MRRAHRRGDVMNYHNIIAPYSESAATTDKTHGGAIYIGYGNSVRASLRGHTR